MTSHASPDIRAAQSSPPRRVSALATGGAVLQLAALGVVGPIVFTILITLLSLGLGLLPVLGIGILFLIAFDYAPSRATPGRTARSRRR